MVVDNHLVAEGSLAEDNLVVDSPVEVGNPVVDRIETFLLSSEYIVSGDYFDYRYLRLMG